MVEEEVTVVTVPRDMDAEEVTVDIEGVVVTDD